LDTPSAEKVALRRAVLARRDALSAAERAEHSRCITEALRRLPEVAQARRILAYLSFASEFDTAALIDALRAGGARIVLPRVERAQRSLSLYAVDDFDTDLAPGVWGIREPNPDRCERVVRESLDLVIAPGVAFTPRGDRLGYGGGFYDRLLGDWPQRPPIVAGTFEAQIVDTLPLDPHDVPVDRVVTQARVLSRAG